MKRNPRLVNSWYSPGKPKKPFQPGVDPVPVPDTVVQHPVGPAPGEAKPV